MVGIDKNLFLIYATLLSVLGLFASDMYIPALSPIRHYFDTNSGMVGLSLSIYMAGFAVAQLFYGALSDQLGRKRPLIFGLVLFLLGTLGCIYARSIETFIFFRIVQSLGVGAAYVLWQPMVIDLFDKKDLQKIFSLLFALGAISPALAPLVGGLLTKWIDWHAVFWLIIFITSILIIWTMFAYRESLAIEARRKFSVAKLLHSYLYFLKSHFFLGYALTIACGITLYFVFLTMLPFVLAKIGYESASIGMMYIPVVLAFILGTQICNRQYRRNGDVSSILIGSGFAIIGAIILMLVSIYINVSHAWQIVAPFTIIAFGNGFIVPTCTAFLLNHYKERSGVCASLIGFLTASMAFVSTTIASSMIDNLGIHAMTITILFFSFFLAASLYIGRRNDSVAAGTV